MTTTDVSVIDVSAFQEGGGDFAQPVHLIVKSQDQVERRARLVEAKQRGRIGRIEKREVATGLWVKCQLRAGKKISRENCSVKEFLEPRGLVRIEENLYLLSDINRVLLVNQKGDTLQEYTHPYFAFLHSISFDPVSRKFLVVSSGYDCLIEMDIGGRVCWEWFAWEHGFNPTLDGVYLCRQEREVAELRLAGKDAIFVDPTKNISFGLITSQRSNHPNSGSYHPRKADVVLVTLGHSGEVIEITKSTGEWRKVVTGLRAMPHGIQPCNEGWMVTNTLMGEFWLLDAKYTLITKIVTSGLPGKPTEMAAHEWLQATYPIGNYRFIGLDANRGLIYVDVKEKIYRIFPVEESWCVHHMVLATD